jgi:glycosyltransferase involved in cell wall biosynthesis
MVRPLVTAIVGSYNQARYVEECLESVRGQTYSPVQIVIVDDGSPDDSVAVIRRWLDRNHVEAELIAHGENRGVCASANDALVRARGKYVALIAGDDRWAADKIERQVEHIEELSDDYGLLYGALRKIDDEGTPIPRRRSERQPPEGDVYRSLIRENFISASTVLVRRSCFDLAGAFDETLLFEDYDMWLRLARVCRVAYCPSPSTYSRRHSMSFGERERRNPRWIETLVRIDVKQLEMGISEAADRVLVAQRILSNMKRLYPAENARYAACFKRVSEVYKHPLLVCFYLFRRLGVPFVFVRALWGAWLVANRPWTRRRGS